MKKTIRVSGALRSAIKEKIDEVFNEFYADGHNGANLGPGSKVLRETILEAVMGVSADNPFLIKSSGEIANTNSSNG